ncbi:MAG TPA: hypothetical protein VE756_00795, partial [Burkholderiales bacterium]|nr:hypothetical protein [Burkholderiales bacterium]
RAQLDELQTQRAAGDVARERGDADAAQAEARLMEIRTALDELERRRQDAEVTLTALHARVLEAQADLEAQTERARLGAEQAPAVAVPAAAAAPRPMATLLLVAFLFGALAMGVTAYLLLQP